MSTSQAPSKRAYLARLKLHNMSDTNEDVTRKLPGGKKIVEKVSETVTEEQNEAGPSTITRVVKKRKLADGDLRFVVSSSKILNGVD